MVKAVPGAHIAVMTAFAWIANAARQPLVLDKIELGALAHEEVEVAVEHCGLCHSDLSVLKNDWGNANYPAILGHEVIGRVTALGPNTKNVVLGQRVGVGWNAGSCMHCRQCMTGRHHLCPEVQPTILGHRGGFASHIRSHWAWVIPLPESLNPVDAGPLMCAGITVFAPILMYAKPVDRVAILGVGGLGHLAVKFAAAYGCHVTAITSSESKFDEARALGAHDAVASTDPAAISKLAGSFDLLLSTVNVRLDWDALIATLAPGGRLHLVGAVLEPIPVAAFSLIFQQRSISGSPTGAPAAIGAMLDFAARHDVLPVTEHFPMSQINAAFARLDAGKAHYRIVLDADF
jgi:uncharacterized zinc-type alcohol dehydrogenase-like protein